MRGRRISYSTEAASVFPEAALVENNLGNRRLQTALYSGNAAE
jgi:hypothetical protein